MGCRLTSDMRPGSFTQIYIHLAFSPLRRECLIKSEHKDELYKYINETIRNLKHKPVIINGMPGHIHILAGLNPAQSVSGLVRGIKRSSSKLINDNRWFMGDFHWQVGYGGFSYGRPQSDDICKYIQNQELHHRKGSFKEEYTKISSKI